jgi:hypothetical protein
MGNLGPDLTLYKPRPQQALLHESVKRFKVLVAHRRFGKTVFCVNELIARAARNELSRPRYAYVAPLLTQAKDVAWEYVKHYAGQIPDASVHETELRVDLPGGGRIRLYGADNPDRLRGLYLDGVVLDEYAQMQPRIWPEVIRPALADRGGWAVFIGTPMGRNAFHALYHRALGDPAWHAAMFRASQTGIIASSELEAARLDMSEEQYAQEFECSFDAAVVGSYYGRLITAAEGERRVGTVPWEPAAPVVTGWDLGIGDSTAIWFAQAVGGEVRLIDYLENSGAALSWYAGELMERRQRGWAFAEHLLPHDAQVRELGTGKSRVETLRGLGINPRVLPALPVDDGINAARLLLPRCWFDRARCERGLDALRQYRRSWDEQRKAFSSRPLHDWTSHAADAFRYLAVGLRPPPRKRPSGEAGVLAAGGWMG